MIDEPPLRVVALVAAKDRADTVAATVSALRTLPGVDDVLVVDDGSTDGTAEAALDAGAWVLRLGENRGKGGAVAAGVAATPETDVYVLADADVGVTATAIGELIPPVLTGAADMVVGVLPSAGGKGGFGLVRGLAAAGIRRACGFRSRAPLSGQRVVRGPLLRALVLAPRFGLETALTIDAVRAGATVVEIPVAVDHRHTGRRLSGFAHRARQGADIARALWPRLSSAAARMAIIAAALVVGLAAALWSGSRSQPSSVAASRPASKVLLVGIPGLGFDDLGTGAMPVLDGLVDQGALAAMTVRTRSPDPAVTEGYATLGAGSRVTASNRHGVAADRNGRVEVGPVAALRQGAGRWLPTAPGALGDALHAAGLRTAVVGNADLPGGLSNGLTPGPAPTAELGGRPAVLTPAAVALMDGQGVVDAGTVAYDLLTRDRSAPFGVRADPDRVVVASRAALEAADVVLVDAGDLTRVEALDAPPDFAARSRARAVADADALLGRLTSGLPADTLVLVVSVVPPDDQWRLTPMVAAGAGVTHGYVHSPSTRRLGLVTLTDVAPTVLAAVDAPVPAAMVGHALRYAAGEPDEERLARLDRDAAYRERVYLPVAVAFIVAQALVYLLAIAAFSREGQGGVPRWWRPGLRLAVLAFAAFPLATFLFRALPFAPGLGPAGVSLLVVLVAALVAVTARARRSPLSPLGWLLAATSALIVVDVATGARLQSASILGYSPHTAGRFYGLGNTGFAALGSTAILAAVLHLASAPRRREALAAVAALWALVVVVDAAPDLGDDVGGVLTLVPVMVLAFAALAGRRLTRGVLLAAGAATLALLAAATTVDVLRPPEARTHLGRFAADLAQNGLDPLFTTIARKASVNARILRGSVWTWMVPVIAGFVLYLVLWRRRGGQLLAPGSPLRIGVVATLVFGLLGSVVNDSGVVVAATALVYVGPLLALLAHVAEPVPPVLLEPPPHATRPAMVATSERRGDGGGRS